MTFSIARYLKVFLILQFFCYSAGGRVSGYQENFDFPKQLKSLKKELKSNTVSEEPSDNEKHKKRRYKSKGTQVSIPSVTIGEFLSFFITNEFLLELSTEKILFLPYYSPGKRGPPGAFHV